MRPGEIDNLTSGTRRKPLLGSGAAEPVAFERTGLTGILVVATDGFCNYVKLPELIKKLPFLDFPIIPRTLVEMVRLRSGELWDDVTIVACRRRPPSRCRLTVSSTSMDVFLPRPRNQGG